MYSDDLISRIMSGAVGVLPTDTVYGIVARVADEQAVDRLYTLKNRQGNPGTIIASSIDQLIDMGVDQKHIDIAKVYWPNPISVIIPVGEELKYLHQGYASLAFRVVADEELASLLKKTGPLMTSSANLSGKPVANSIDEARQYFNDKVDFYVDGGDLSERLSSTIIAIENGEVRVIRQGVK